MFYTISHEWDALNLYIANNIDWMMVWIERSQQNGLSLTWEGVASLVKEAHHNGDSSVTPMVIDLANSLRSGKVCIN